MKKPGDNGENRRGGKRSLRSRCGCCIVILIALVVAGVISSAVGIRVFVNSKMDPTDWQKIATYKTQFLSLPPEWHRPADVPPDDVVEFHDELSTRLDKLWTKHIDLLDGDNPWGDPNRTTSSTALITRMRAEDTPTSAELEKLKALLTDFQSLVDETSAITALEGYTYDLDINTTDVGVASFQPAQRFTFLTSVAALSTAREGNCDDATEMAMLPVHLMKRPAESTLIAHLTAISNIDTVAETMSQIASECTNTQDLKYGLDLLTRLEDTAFPGDISHWQFGDSLGELRHLAAAGYPVDLSPQPLAGYFQQLSLSYQRGKDDWLIASLPEDDKRHIAAKARAKKSAANRASADAGWISKKLTSVIPGSVLEKFISNIVGMGPAELLYINISEMRDSTDKQLKLTLANYDLTRLKFAQRLVELEQPTSASDSMASAVTAYIQPLPLDPFTSAPMKFSPEHNKFYSVGTDLKDDGGKEREGTGLGAPGDVVLTSF